MTYLAANYCHICSKNSTSDDVFPRNSQTAPHVLTAEERERRDEERKESIRQYRAWRQSVLQSRDEDRQFRNNEKVRQLQDAEKQQVCVCSCSFV